MTDCPLMGKSGCCVSCSCGRNIKDSSPICSSVELCTVFGSYWAFWYYLTTNNDFHLERIRLCWFWAASSSPFVFCLFGWWPEYSQIKSSGRKLNVIHVSRWFSIRNYTDWKWWMVLAIGINVTFQPVTVIQFTSQKYPVHSIKCWTDWWWLRGWNSLTCEIVSASNAW